MQSVALRLAAVTGFLAVALGAFGAHGLESTLARNGTVTIWETAVLYHLAHAVALLVLALSNGWRPGPWWSFFLGVVVFSGTLYLLALTNLRWLGMITPIGGVAFLVGWAWLIISPAPRASPVTEASSLGPVPR
jgi:uncharacterized membrane protein YgdD (TMEM256/DUF423 family)